MRSEAGEEIRLRLPCLTAGGVSSTGSVVSGATTGTLVVSKIGGADAAQYWLEAKNSAGVVITTLAQVKIASVPVITQQPVSPVDAKVGAPLVLSVVAAGTNPLSYHWKRNGAVVLTSSSSTYQVLKMAAADFGKYSVRVYNGYGEAVSSEVAVAVSTTTAAAPVGK